MVIVLCVAAPDALRAFGPGYESGETTLRILLVGQLVNAATGSVGFILIMVGRTGLDLLDNALAVAVLVGLAAPLASGHGMEGAAIAAAVAIGGVNLIRLVQVHRIVRHPALLGRLPAAAGAGRRPAPRRRWRRRR